VTISGVDQLHARFNANAFSGRVEGGNRMVTSGLGGIGLTPYAAAQAINFDLPAYAEAGLSGAGTLALTYAAKSVTATRSELGLRSDKFFAVGDAILTLRGRAAGHTISTPIAPPPRRSRRCPAQASSSMAQRRRTMRRSPQHPPR
jgi:uncharacterized protein with beta-barrel porin domain